jgi:hypothetical protein
MCNIQHNIRNKTACDSTFSFLGLQDAGLNCLCEGDLAGDGMTQAIATCSTPTSRCITTNQELGETICGAVVLDGVFSANNGRDLRTYVNACITIDVATPWLAGYDYDDDPAYDDDDPVYDDDERALYDVDEPHAPYHLCVSVQNSPDDDGGLLDFVSCVATLDGQSCSCRLCEAGVPAVTLDCSNVTMPSSEKTYHGPKMNVCSRLDFSPLE